MKKKWEWLEQRINDCGYTRVEFSKVIDWSVTRLYEMCSNTPVNGGKIRNIPFRKLQFFSDKLKIDYKSLSDYNDDLRDDVVFLPLDTEKNEVSEVKNEEPTNTPQNLVSIDVIDAKKCRGDDIENLSDNAIGQQMMTPAALKAYTKTNPDDVKIINAIGDSMSPTINSGDFVWIDISCTTPRADGLYVIVIGDAMSIKRLQIHPFTGSITIKSDNQRYEDYIAENADDIRVVGKVIYHVRRVG